MLKRFPKLLYFILILFLLKNNGFAQSMPDSLVKPFTDSRYAKIESDFNKKMGFESRLYNGFQYDTYDPKIKGNAYFDDVNTWSKGNVFYDGFAYTNVDMMYDIYKDQLVIPLYNNFLKISLQSEKVKSFDMLGHHFIYIKNDPSNPNSLSAGFYEELYHGKIQVLAKKAKSMQTALLFPVSVNYFTASKDYYIVKNGKQEKTNGKGSFLDVLKDHKKEIKAFIKANNIDYQTNPEIAMAAIAAYYDHLTE